MTLEVWTARISSKDPDRFDITRKSGDASGIVFAPSWAILRPALAARKQANEEALAGLFHDALNTEIDAWAVYVPAFLAEMRASYKVNRGTWAALLARPRVVLVCYCTDPRYCHRTVIASGILPKLGAEYRGEFSRAGEPTTGDLFAAHPAPV